MQTAGDVERVEVEDGAKGRATDFSIMGRRGRWRDGLRRRVLLSADIVVVLGAPAFLAALGQDLGSWWIWAALAPVWVGLAKLHGLYDRDHSALHHLTADELPSLITWATMGIAGAAVVFSMVAVEAPDATAFVLLWLTVLGLGAALRTVARMCWRAVTPPESVVILGMGSRAQAVRRKLELFGETHARVVGMVDDAELAGLSRSPGGLPALLSQATGSQPVDRIVLAANIDGDSVSAELVSLCREWLIKLTVIPPAQAMVSGATTLGHLAELPLVEYNTADISRSTMLIKRSFDVALAGCGIVVLAPLLGLIALAVRVDSRGPGIFVQVRAGLGGTPFRMYKFRTMSSDAEERLSEVVSVADLEDPMFKLRTDPRVTRIGRLLRRLSLDELPQLMNVLRGDMSLVGPRPEQIDLVGMYRPEHRFRLAVKPGLTGPMQVFGRGELTFEERLAVERDYVDNLSFARDFRILLLTGSAVLRGRGAF